MDKKQKIKDFWNKEYNDYDLHMKETNHYNAQSEIIESLKDEIKSPILDIACGSGFLTEILFKKYKDVQANDFSLSMINVAQKRLPEVLFTNDDAETLESYKQKTYNTVIVNNLFFYIQNRDMAIKRWKELLKIDGKIILIEEYPFLITKEKNFSEKEKELLSIIDPISPEEIKNYMINNGFIFIKDVFVPIDSIHNLYGLVFHIPKF